MAQQEKSEKPKKRGMFEQIVTIYKFTAAEDKALPWITGAVFAAPIVVGIICGIVFVMLFVACKIKWPFFLCIGGGVGLLAVAPYIGHLLVKLHILKDGGSHDT